MIVVPSSTGCTTVGPDYVRPPTPTATDWIETNEPAVKREATEVSTWWTVFHDPVLNTLVETTYRQNPSLWAAGVCVLEAQAQRGIALGQLFPQQYETTVLQAQEAVESALAGYLGAQRQVAFLKGADA
jgi:outer membrane protein TolC